MLQPIIKKSITSIAAMIFLLVVLFDACNTRNKNQVAGTLEALIPGYIHDSIYLSPGNRFTTVKAALGRYFFYDRRLSVNQAKSCASCHDPAFSFTDGYRCSIGTMGDNVQHNAPALINIVFKKYLTAADSTLHFPEQQINNPMFHDKPVELGWKGNEKIIIARLEKDSFYNQQMPLLFPDSKESITLQNIQACITSFIKTIISFNSPYDRYLYKNDSTALSASQLNGMKLFFSDRLHCSSCHSGINFSAPALTGNCSNLGYFQNTGLYNIGGRGGYPVGDCGLLEYTGQIADMGRYRIASLRNLAFTAPYLHDGTAADLSAVIDIYQNGGRNIATGFLPRRWPQKPLQKSADTGFCYQRSRKKRSDQLPAKPVR